MLYEYTSQNRLEKPHHYMYTKYNDTAFLNAYFEDRTGIAGQLVEREFKMFTSVDSFDLTTFLWENRYYYNELIESTDFRIEEILAQEQINSISLSSSILIKLIKGELTKEEEQIIYNTLSVFVKKYEVYKRIFTEYSRTFRKRSSNYYCFQVYLNYAVCFLLLYSKNKCLKFLNCALKVNDMLCSCIDDFSTENEKKSLFINLLLEKKAIEELMKIKKIDL